MKPGWKKIPFADALGDESGGNVKTPQSDFQSKGRFPVVDQGKDLIAGYVDDESRTPDIGPGEIVRFGAQPGLPTA